MRWLLAYPRGLCDVTLNAAKALLPCTQEMSSDWGQGQWQKKLLGIDGALDKLGGQATSGTSGYFKGLCLFLESTSILTKTLVSVPLWQSYVTSLLLGDSHRKGPDEAAVFPASA